MLLKHKFIQDRVLLVEPMADKSYPRHAAFISQRDGERATYSAVLRTWADAVKYAAEHSYIVPHCLLIGE